VGSDVIAVLDVAQLLAIYESVVGVLLLAFALGVYLAQNEATAR